MRGVVAILGLALALTACSSGRDFARPNPSTFTLGQTTLTEIVQQFGPPMRQATEIIGTAREGTSNSPFEPAWQPGTLSRLSYAHATTNPFGNSPRVKTLIFLFWNERMIQYSFSSDFTDDSTNFDQGKISEFKKDVTTKENVIFLFGDPTGRSIYPTIRSEGDERFSYAFIGVDRLVNKRRAKYLEIIFAGNGTLRDYRFLEDDQPLPQRSAPAYVPMVIPTPRK
jgi:hypothetical protein